MLALKGKRQNIVRVVRLMTPVSNLFFILLQYNIINIYKQLLKLYEKKMSYINSNCNYTTYYQEKHYKITELSEDEEERK